MCRVSLHGFAEWVIDIMFLVLIIFGCNYRMGMEVLTQFRRLRRAGHQSQRPGNPQRRVGNPHPTNATQSSELRCYNSNSPHPNPFKKCSSPQALDICLLPSPVQSLRAETDGRGVSVILRWSHPTENWSEVNSYEIRYKRQPAEYNSSFKLRTIPCHCETFTLTRDDGIEPLNKYLFEIRPMSGHVGLHTEWTSTVVFISEYF